MVSPKDINSAWVKRCAQHQTPLGAAANFMAYLLCNAVLADGREFLDVLKNELLRLPLRFAYPYLLHPDNIEISSDRVSISNNGEKLAECIFDRSLGCVLLPLHMSAQDAEMYLAKIKLTYPKSPNTKISKDVILEKKHDGSCGAIITACNSAFDKKQTDRIDDTSCLLVLKGNQIIYERYNPDCSANTKFNLWSISKAITSILIGRGHQIGLFDMMQTPILNCWNSLPRNDFRSSINLYSLAFMNSGLSNDDGQTDCDTLYYRGMPPLQFFQSLISSHIPGSHTLYSNIDVYAASCGMRSLIGNDTIYYNFPYKEMFGPLGMDETYIEPDIYGNFVLSKQTRSTARDLAKFGLLCSNWNNLADRLLPPNWLDQLRTPSKNPCRENAVWPFGGQFWLPGTEAGLTPQTMYAAGAGWQSLIIIPEHDLILVRLNRMSVFGRTNFDSLALASKILSAIEQ